MFKEVAQVSQVAQETQAAQVAQVAEVAEVATECQNRYYFSAVKRSYKQNIVNLTSDGNKQIMKGMTYISKRNSGGLKNRRF